LHITLSLSRLKTSSEKKYQTFPLDSCPDIHVQHLLSDRNFSGSSLFRSKIIVRFGLLYAGKYQLLGSSFLYSLGTFFYHLLTSGFKYITEPWVNTLLFCALSIEIIRVKSETCEHKKMYNYFIQIVPVDSFWTPTPSDKTKVS
jgi:hypothetical protein